MKVEIAQHAGFCNGVKRAFDTALAQDSGTKVLGQLVHNPDVDQILNENGIVQVRSVEEVKEGDKVVIRAHGETTPTLGKLRELQAEIVDCTCRKVKRIQRLAEDHSREGGRVAVFGKNRHPEFESICSFAGDDVIRISSLAEIAAINEDIQRLTLLAQTTSQPGEYNKVKAALQSQVHDFKAPNTLCDFTRKALSAAIKLAQDVDAMLVIGGLNSSNTKNLVIACIEQKVRTHLIERVDGLAKIDLGNVNKIGIAAGASTPSSAIQSVVHALEDM